MKKKIVWLVVSCLMALSLVLASCGEAEEEEDQSADDENEKGKGASAAPCHRFRRDVSYKRPRDESTKGGGDGRII